MSENRTRIEEDRFLEFGSRTRRRPIEQDYAAAIDAEIGKRKKDRGQKTDD